VKEKLQIYLKYMDGPNLKRMAKKVSKMKIVRKVIFLCFILFGFEGICFFFGYQDALLHSPPIKQIIHFLLI